MSTIATDIFICLFILGLGFFLGYTFKKWLFNRNRSGTIRVSRREGGRILYSLELSDYPETLEFKKVVIFDVDTSE